MIESHALGRAIRLQRERRGLTQRALANLLGVSQQAVSRWESGGAVPEPAQRANLTAALGTDPGDASELSAAQSPVASRSLLRSLPLRNLSAIGFEVFCADLIHLWAGAKPNRWGGQGHAQGGVDIVAEMPDGRVFAFQCKNRERFGPSQVAEAVAAVSTQADRHFLLISRTASPAARSAIAQFAAWELWDDDDLSRIVRYDIDRDGAMRLVDTHFSGLREAFFGIADPGPWLTTEEFFRPFTGNERVLSHDWELIGRRREVDETTRRLRNDRVALVTGTGGSGKTRFLKAVAEAYDQRSMGRSIRFLAENVALEPRHLEQLGSDELLVVIDDAHDRKDLDLLFQGIGRFAPKVKLLLSTRPFAEVPIRGELARCGLAGHEQANEITLRLPPLTIDQSISLSRQVLDAHGGSSALAPAVANLTADCPLATVVGSRLMADELAHPRSLRTAPGFRDTIMWAFRDELLGTLGPPGDERDLRYLLDVVALVQPVEDDDPRFGRLAGTLLGQPADRLVRLMGSLETAGVVRRRGRTLRVAPDVLADQLIMKACWAQGTGHPTPFADRAFRYATSQYRLNIVRNLARLDWEMSAETGSRLLSGIWEAIRSQFRESGVMGRWELLKALSDISWFQPERAIDLARLAIDEPPIGDDDHDFRARFGLDTDADVVREAIPSFLRGAAHHADYLPEVFQLLWELGRDKRSLTGRSDHPIRVLQEVASLRVDAPLVVLEAAVDVACSWLQDPSLEQYAHSPFDVLNGVLETEILDLRRDRHSTGVQALPIPWPKTLPLRAKVLHAAFDMLAHDSLRVRARALETIGCAVRPLRTSFERHPGDEERSGWESEVVGVFERLRRTLAEHDLDPVLLDRIELMAGRRTRDGDAVSEAKHAVLAALPDTDQRKLTRAIRHEWAPAIFMLDRPYDEVGPEWLQFQQSVAEDLIRGRSPDEVIDLLARRMAELDEHSRQFFAVLFRAAPEVAHLIVDRRQNGADATFDCVLDLAIAQWRVDDLARARAWLLEAVERDDHAFIQAVVRAMGLDRVGVSPPALDEVRVLRALGGHPEEAIRSAVAELARRIAIGSPGLALDLLSGVTVRGSAQVGRATAWQFSPFGLLRVEDLDPRQRRHLLDELEEVAGLEDDSVGGLLGSLSRVVPLDVVELLQRRVDHWRETPTRPHQPVPFDWADGHSPLRLHESPNFTEALRSIRGWTFLHFDDAHHLFWAPQLWAAAAGDYDSERALDCLREWLPSPDPRELMTVSALLAGAPRSFVWGSVTDVVALLDRAEGHGRDCLRRVRRDLWACAMSGVRELTPREPCSDDVKQRDQGADVASELPWSSPARLFYSDLSRAAESAINAMTRFDGESEEV